MKVLAIQKSQLPQRIFYSDLEIAEKINQSSDYSKLFSDKRIHTRPDTIKDINPVDKIVAKLKYRPSILKIKEKVKLYHFHIHGLNSYTMVFNIYFIATIASVATDVSSESAQNLFL